jgi:aryl-alcohol dehydrogenase-like predicted oxidoreductase
VSDAQGYARFVAAQYQYSLVKRDIEYEFEDLLRSEGVGLTPWGALGGGFLSGKYKRGEKPTLGRIATTGAETEEAWERRSHDRNWAIIDAVGAIAEARGITYSQVALAWVRAQPMTSSVIIGVRTLDQLADNLAAATLELTPNELIALNQASALPELYPYRMIDVYAQRQAHS